MKILQVMYIMSMILFILYPTPTQAQKNVLIVKVLKGNVHKNSSITFNKLIPSVVLETEKRLYTTKQKRERAPYKLQILNRYDQIIYEQKFGFVHHIEVPLLEPGKKSQSKKLRVPLRQPEVVLMVPYFSDGFKIRVIGDGIKKFSKRIPKNLKYMSSSKMFKSSKTTFLNKGGLHILLIASGFSNITDFQIKAREIKNYLLSKEPFASNKEYVNILTYENKEDLGCASGCYGINRLMCCDSTKVMEAALRSGKPYDEIIIIHNTSTYSGAGYRDNGAFKSESALSYAAVYNGRYSAAMALHEFGHSFGNLCDEYAYTDEGYSYSNCVNCKPSCSSWSNVSTGCQLGCDARKDYYRPENSIMFSYDYPYYNSTSIKKSLIPRLDYFISRSSNQNLSALIPIYQLLLSGE